MEFMVVAVHREDVFFSLFSDTRLRWDQRRVTVTEYFESEPKPNRSMNGTHNEVLHGELAHHSDGILWKCARIRIPIFIFSAVGAAIMHDRPTPNELLYGVRRHVSHIVVSISFFAVAWNENEQRKFVSFLWSCRRMLSPASISFSVCCFVAQEIFSKKKNNDEATMPSEGVIANHLCSLLIFNLKVSRVCDVLEMMTS